MSDVNYVFNYLVILMMMKQKKNVLVSLILLLHMVSNFAQVNMTEPFEAGYQKYDRDTLSYQQGASVIFKGTYTVSLADSVEVKVMLLDLNDGWSSIEGYSVKADGCISTGKALDGIIDDTLTIPIDFTPLSAVSAGVGPLYLFQARIHAKEPGAKIFSNGVIKVIEAYTDSLKVNYEEGSYLGQWLTGSSHSIKGHYGLKAIEEVSIHLLHADSEGVIIDEHKIIVYNDTVGLASSVIDHEITVPSDFPITSELPADHRLYIETKAKYTGGNETSLKATIKLTDVDMPSFSFNDVYNNNIRSNPEIIWRQTAPGMSGRNRNMSAHATDSSIIWQMPDMGNDYVTTDGGVHWTTVHDVDGNWDNRRGLSNRMVASHPLNENLVLSLNSGTTFDISYDKGISFQKYTINGLPGHTWAAIEGDPVDENTWTLGAGHDWFYQYRNALKPNPVKPSNIKPAQAKVWILKNISGSPQVSPLSNTGMPDTVSVISVMRHPNVSQYPNMYFAGTSLGTYRYDGSLWEKIVDGCTRFDYHYDASNKTLRMYVLVMPTYEMLDGTIVSDGDILVSDTPETASLGSGWNNSGDELRVDLSQTAVTNSQVTDLMDYWLTGDKRSDVVTLTSLPTDFFPNFIELEVDPTNKYKAYLANGRINSDPTSVVTGPIWATNDGGNTWFPAARLGYGFERDAFWKTKDHFKTNRNVPLQIFEEQLEVSYDEAGARDIAMAANGDLFASVVIGNYTIKYDSENDVWMSIDNVDGPDHSYWGTGNGNISAHKVIPDMHRPGEMFLLLNEHAVWKTTDNYNPDYPDIPAIVPYHGTRVRPYYDVPVTLAQHPGDTNTFYFISTRTGDFCKSSNNGASFSIIGEPVYIKDGTILRNRIYWNDLTITPGVDTMYAIAEVIDRNNSKGQNSVKSFYDPKDPASIYKDVTKGIYKTTDAGKNWFCVNENLPKMANGPNDDGTNPAGTASSALRMSPADPSLLYLAVRQYKNQDNMSQVVAGGLFRSSNGAESWEKLTTPEAVTAVWDVYLDNVAGQTEKIYIACGSYDGKLNAKGGLFVADYKPNGDYSASDWTMLFDHPMCQMVRVSELNRDYILLATKRSTVNGKRNAGTFITMTGGKAGDGSDWHKINAGRGSMENSGIAFDNKIAERIWWSGQMSGIFTARFKSLTQKVNVTIKVLNTADNQALSDVKVNLGGYWAVTGTSGEVNYPSVNIGDYLITVKESGKQIFIDSYQVISDTTLTIVVKEPTLNKVTVIVGSEYQDYTLVLDGVTKISDSEGTCIFEDVSSGNLNLSVLDGTKIIYDLWHNINSDTTLNITSALLDLLNVENFKIAENIRLLANMVERELHIIVHNLVGAEYKIVNSIGQQLKQGQLYAGKQIISIQELKQGAYFIAFYKDGAHFSTEKFIIVE